MKRKEVPKKVKQIPRAPLVLIWDTILVVTVAYSTSGRRKRSCFYPNAFRDSEQGSQARGSPGEQDKAPNSSSLFHLPTLQLSLDHTPEQNQIRSLRMKTDMYSTPCAAE